MTEVTGRKKAEVKADFYGHEGTQMPQKTTSSAIPGTLQCLINMLFSVVNTDLLWGAWCGAMCASVCICDTCVHMGGVCTHKYVHDCVHICACVCMQTRMEYAHVWLCICVHCVYVSMYMYVCTCMWKGVRWWIKVVSNRIFAFIGILGA